MFTRIITMLARPAAIEAMRTSRLPTWLISCPSAARSSRSESSPRRPSVTQTAACSGLRPVTKAFGADVGEM